MTDNPPTTKYMTDGLTKRLEEIKLMALTDIGDMKEMLTLAVGCFAEKLQDPEIQVARPHFQNAFDLASKMLDTYWRPDGEN